MVASPEKQILVASQTSSLLPPGKEVCGEQHCTGHKKGRRIPLMQEAPGPLIFKKHRPEACEQHVEYNLSGLKAKVEFFCFHFLSQNSNGKRLLH